MHLETKGDPMEHIKIFWMDIGSAISMGELEKKINQWLTTNSGKINVVRVLQSECKTDASYHITLSIFYKTSCPAAVV